MGVGMLVKAALTKKKSGGEFTGLEATRPPVRVELGHAARYAEVCGFPVKDVAPLTYPHLLGFPLHIELMSKKTFPAPVMGMVHVQNALTSHRPISIGEQLRATVRVDPGVPHPVGTTYQFHTDVRDERDETVWESVSTYLHRGVRNPDAVRAPDLPVVPPTGTVFRLPSDLGRRYAAVSGDYNPIHLTALTAKALGFKRHIAHGMWTKARCLAALENRLPEQVHVDVAFKKPVFLPSSVAFGSVRTDAGYDFSLHKRGSDTLHLVGTVSDVDG